MAETFSEGLIQAGLIKQLQNILEQYPDDGQILKELIQNAEDAGAGTVKFLIDHTQYGTQSLASNQLKLQQGPALYAYNDAVFTDDDWTGIRMIQDSLKNKDPLKVGRFGLGFKSVFHMTDLPGILSGNQVGFIDPQEEYLFKQESSRLTGDIRPVKTSSLAWQLSAKLYIEKTDQFTPFIQNIFNVSANTFISGSYPGTVFRFPLRVTQNSQISSTLYTIEKVQELFHRFYQDAHFMLLFLKHVHTVEVYEKKASQEVVLLHEVKIANQLVKEVSENRRNFVESIRQVKGNKPIACSYIMETEVDKTDKIDWLVTQIFDTALADVQSDGNIKNLPLVGVALPLQCNQVQHYSRGHTFCVLPMPITEDNKTGLNVHVNGFFAVDQNRRHLKWPERDTAAGGNYASGTTFMVWGSNQGRQTLRQSDVEWNYKLLQQSVPLAMWEAVKYAVECSKRAPWNVPSSDVYNIFPDKTMVHKNWQSVVEPFWKKVVAAQDPCLYSSINTWVCPSEAYLIRMEDRACIDMLKKVILKAKLPLVQPPDYIHNELAQRNACRMVTPSLISQVMNAAVLSPEERVTMIWYLFNGKGGSWILLLGKYLLPIQQECHYVAFSSEASPVYLETEECKMSLLPAEERQHVMAKCCLADGHYKLFKQIAQTGRTQLRLLSPEDIPELLHNMFGRITVPHEIGVEWLKELWYFILSTGGIDLYEGLPIVACTEYQWDYLRSYEAYVEDFQPHARKNKILQQILRKVGVKTVSFMQRIISSNYREMLADYISPATVGGILDAMLKPKPQQHINVIWDLTDNEKRQLLSFIASGCTELHEPKYRKIIEGLPLFLCYETTKGDPIWTCKSHHTVKYCADIDLPVALPVKVAKAEECGIIAHFTGVPILSDTQIIVDHVFPAILSTKCYSPDQIQSTMIRVLKDIEHHLCNIKNFKEHLRKIPFVMSQAKYVPPNTLLDPSNLELKQLFQGVDVFPTGTFAKPEYILKLQGCFEELSDEKLIVLAKFIDSHPNSMQSLKQGKLLLECVEENIDNISVGLCNSLKNLKWVPVQNKSPKFYPPCIPWFGEKQTLSDPMSLGFTEHSYLIGSIKPVSQITMTNLVREKLCCPSHPSIEEVTQHLTNIVKNFRIEEMSPVHILKQVYSFMAAQDVYKVKESLCKLDCKNWIWAGGLFRSIHQVTIGNVAVNMEPYITEIPKQFSEWSTMFRNLGVQEIVPMENVLLEIKLAHEKQQQPKEECARDLSTCVKILRHLVENDLTLQVNKLALPVPINTDGGILKLVEAEHCTFSPDPEGITDGELSIVHRDVPFHIVKALEIPNMMTRFLDAQELEFDNFGQSEPLTRRIKGLLEDYKDGVAVLKELIQNADDAGATEVHFMYDSRDFRGSSHTLIDPQMKFFQGPALLCYNNERFSEEDFTNIVKLGGATKEQKVDQVGRFGLGFNAVYNLTDVPSFISGNDIVYFDPHVKYLKQVIKNPSKPGIRINLKTNKEQILILKDQFKLFHGLLGCDLQNERVLPSFKGTLFRFPLRTKKQAVESEISDLHYGRESVVALFRVLQKSADHLLLFVQNVRTVMFSEVGLAADNSVKIQQCGVIKKESLKILRPLQQKPKGTDTDEWKILKCAKSACSHDMHNSYIIEMSTKFEGALFRKAQTTEAWLVSNFVKAKSDKFKNELFLPIGSTGISLKRLGKLLFSPQKVTRERKDGGQVFCFLPLPIETGLPFHINGYFAVTSSRQQLRAQDVNDKTDQSALWNNWLMSEVVVKALLQCLTELTVHGSFFRNVNECLFDFFPVKFVEQDDLLQNLCRSFYQLLVYDTTIEILPSPSGNWIHFDKCRYLDDQLRFMKRSRNYIDCVKTAESGRVAEIMVTVCKKHLANSFVDLPQRILTILGKLGFVNNLQCHKISLQNFYEEIFLTDMTSVDPADRDVLMHYALLHCDGEVDSLLKQTRCVPVVGSDGLMKPGLLVDPSGSLPQLFSKKESPVPIWLTDKYSQQLKKNRKGELKQALKRLGMRVDDITMTEILQRSRTIATQQKAVGKLRCKILLEILSNKLRKRDQEFDDSSANELRNVAFLPVKEKPPQWVYSWRSQVSFIEPAKSFTADDMYLVGCSEYIAEFPGESYDLKKIMFSKKAIPLEKILHQIHHVTTNTKHSGWEIRKKIMTKIYRSLEQKAREDPRAVSDTLKNVSFIQLSDGSFVKPSVCALYLNKNLAPFLYELPREFTSEYKTLTGALEIVKQFSTPVLLNVLRELCTQYSGRKLNKRDIGIAQDVALLLESTGQSIAVEKVFLPDSDGIMAKASELCYNDCTWLKVQQERTLHWHISYPVARALGVTDLRQKTLLEHQIGIPCGQSEKLTRRIKGILDSYPCGPEILKEMLQNADDAEATEVYFILDNRTHRSRSIFDIAWKKLLGPALLLYNNRPFTEKDIEGIKNLGEGSKEHDPMSTGKYGVGFNCVYHVTETPMFLTPDNQGNHILVAFDPHCKYVKGSTMAEPGQRYNDVKKLRTQFPDVFECFYFPQLPEIDLSCGTLFRFPLRTYEMAKESQLKTEEFTVWNCKELFNDFCRGMKEYLIFLKNVKRIRLLEIKNDNKVLILDDVVSEPTGNASDAQVFMQQLKTCSEQVKESELQSLPKYTWKYQTDIQDRKGNRERWLIVNQIGFRNTEFITDDLQAKFKKKGASLIPQGGLAVKVAPLYEMTDEGKFYCLLPLTVSTYLPVHINGTFVLDHESRRNLWQAEKGSKSFKVLWNLAIITGIVAETYVDVVEEMTLSNGHNSLSYAQADLFLSQFQSLFPVLHEKDEYLSALQKSVYAALVRRNVKVLPVVSYLETWKKLDKDYPGKARVSLEFFHICGRNNEVAFWEVFDSHILSADGKVIKHILRNSHFPLVSEHLNIIKDKLAKVTTDLQDARPEIVLRHFLGQTSAKFGMLCPTPLSKTPFVNRHGLETLLLFCKTSLPQYFEGLPMLLMGDNTVHRFTTSQEKTLVSSYHTLVATRKDLFANTLYLRYMDVQNCDKYLKLMSLADLGNLLQYVLPSEMCHCGGVPLQQSQYKWLSEFWKFVDNSENNCKETGIGSLKSRVQVCFKSWCILPVVINGKYYCASPSYLDLVVDIHRSAAYLKMVALLEKLNYPQPLFKEPLTGLVSVWEFVSPKLAEKIIMSLDEPQMILLSIKRAMHLQLINFGFMDVQDCHSLTAYFSDSLSKNLTVTQEVRETLLSIPMFITVFEEQVSINTGDAVYMVTNEVKKAGMKTWCENRRGHIYLKYQESFNDLFTKLGFRCLSFVTMYTDHILCHFQDFDEQERFIHLQEMKRFVEDCSDTGEHVPLLAKLKTTPVLGDETGILRTVDYFFNPHIDLFMEMETAFPPKNIQGSDWIDFLKLIGLQQKPNQNHIESYVKHIEAWSYDTDMYNCCERKCKVLLKAIFKEDSLLQNVSERISGIRFIPQGQPGHKLAALYPVKKQDSRPFISFRGSIVHKSGELCWTQLPMLPSFAVPPELWQRQCLGILPLSLCDVICNLDTVCKEYQDSIFLEKCKLITKCITLAFDFMLKRYDNEDVSAMKEISCVPVEENSRLVRPMQTVTEHLPKEIPPYLYRLTPEFAKYHALLSSVGASKSVTIEQYVFALEEIWKVSLQKKLTPPEIKVVEEALEGFFTMFDKDATQVEKFYLPSCCGGNQMLLQTSKEVIFNDKQKWFKRVQKLALPFMSNLGSNVNIQRVEQVLKQLPVNLQPQYLSKIITEECQETSGETSKSQRCKELEQRLTSEIFHSGVIRIMHDIDSDQDTDAEIGDTELVKTLERVKFYEVAKLVTFLVYNGASIPDSEMQSSYCIQKEGDEIIIYLSESCQEEYQFNCELFDIINELMQDRLKNHGLRVTAIMKCDINQIEEVLDKLSVKQYEMDISRKPESNMPTLGTYIPVEFHHLLQHSMRPLSIGDYVGYEVHDPLDEPGTEEPSSEDPVYIYAKVTEVIIPKGVASYFGYKYKIQIGHDDNVEVSAASLYCFSRSTQNCKELDVAGSSSMDFGQNVDTEDIRKIKEDIRNTLKEAWKLDLSVRKMIIKRLWLKWHPDKNPGREDLCNEVFKYIKWVCDQLEQGLSLSEDSTDGYSPSHRESHHHGSRFWSGFNFDGFARRARSHSHYQERYQSNYSSHSSYTPPRSNTRNPQPSEANRWMRQASYDFDAVDIDSTCYEWACFKYHQAAEKALKATQFAVDANSSSRGHNLRYLCVEIDSCSSLASELENLLSGYSNMRYPDMHNAGRIPHDVYKEHHASKARELTKEILTRCRKFINCRK